MSSKLASYHTGEADRGTALETARQIENPQRRSNTFESTLHVWMSRDPEAATEFIESSSELDAQTRWRLLTPR